VPSVGAAAGDLTCSSPPALASLCWSSGGGKSGSVAYVSGAGSVGDDSNGAAGSRAGAAVAGSAGADPPGADGSGAGAAMASVSLSLTALADLIKMGQLPYKSKRANVYHAIRCKVTVSTSS
jgi:hypothetical protein